MLDFHKNHKNLVVTALTVFAGLSIIIAVLPAFQMQDYEPLPNQPGMTPNESAGLNIYVTENCAACHTQQVRNIEMDNVWGERPSIPSDYYYSKKRLGFLRQSPSLLGSERTGPDLTSIGKRQPGKEWHLLHLYNPRIVVKESIMPSYPWLFEELDSTSVRENDVLVPVPEKYLSKKGNKVIASQEAIQLVSYLQALKQTPMPDASTVGFIPSSKINENDENETGGKGTVNGENLYMQVCAACHQQNGQGLKGAFPPLAGSDVVNDPDYDLMVKIILQGYDARSEYGQMPGFAEQLDDAEIAAIVNHERTSWGNEGEVITEADVKRIRDFVMQLNQ
ncbi:cbb3-type cytochrome c oxidase subunit II [uncultured Croceitalea sp.]|uniref:cbb3-type cytochrome c oxidase subunit II n=1 Tax=uncultured Croceitalea sp. TaxID=1798908 RepID=UPI00374E7892